MNPNEDAHRIPPHVPPERVLEFDYTHVPGVEEDPQLAWKRVQDTAPDIFWTPHHGGHWVATRAEDIRTIQLDHERFSHARLSIRPPQQHERRSIPIELDPPEHTSYRTLISPAFSAKAVAELDAKIRQTTRSLIEGFVARGECEFVADFGKVLPVVVFLGIVDLPMEDRTKLLPLAETIIRQVSLEASLQAHEAMGEYLSRWVIERTARPGTDLISRVTQAKIQGEPIRTNDVIDLFRVVLLGGLDTVASMLAFAARFLATHPEHRRQLIDQPALIANAVDELIRRHGLFNMSRVITHDFEFKGLAFKKGEQIMIPNALFGLDERQVKDPLTVDFHRPQPAQHHAAFGNGPHRCPGSILAKHEIKIFLEEWLQHIPDFRIKPGTRPVQESGVANAVRELYLSWEPGTRTPRPAPGDV